MSVLDHPIVTQRYFFPRETSLPGATRVPTDKGTLACWRSAPPSDRPVLLHFHGNGEVVRDWVDLLPRFARRLGWEVFLAEYRGYGASTGTPALADMCEDLPNIARAIGVPTDRILPMGRSIGSLYAVEWVHRFPDAPGLILESGIHDLLQRLLLRMHPDELGSTLEEMTAEVQARFDQGEKLAAFAGPTLILHAAHDDLVTPDHAEANAAAAQDPELHLLPRGDHNSILAANSADYLRLLADFLARAAD